MSCIATDGLSMAGDSLITGARQLVGYMEKVHAHSDGRIWGATGNSDDAQKFSAWMRGEGDRPKLDDDFEALILVPDGKVYWIGSKLEPVEYITPQAIGSGGDLALGAMLAGKTPAEAVRIAAERDQGTGGDVTSISRPWPVRPLMVIGEVLGKETGNG